MASEPAVNGSHEPEIDTKNEKILKPRKPESNEEIIIQNGNSENGLTPDSIEKGTDENGSEPNKNVETDKTNNKVNQRLSETRDQREGSKTRHLGKKRESTPKLESPVKRELRRRDNTPKPSTPKKRGTPIKTMHTKKEESEETKSEENMEDADESVIIVEEMNGEKQTNGTEEHVVTSEQKEKSFFSIFHTSSRSELEPKDNHEASSPTPSIICLDSPSIEINSDTPNSDIKARRPINSFSRFPGRNISIISLDSSQKRKADDSSFSSEGRKRFAGDTSSGSERSPGWKFIPSSLSRGWTPSPRLQKSSVQVTSTPFNKRPEDDSMAVNFNDTKMSFSEVTPEEGVKHKPVGKWCSVM